MNNSSYERVNYRLRFAKFMERRMIFDSLVRLSNFKNIADYRYVGFGSIYFTDFILVHKLLGISELISIESEEDNKARFEFNKPFNCIEILWGESSSILPELGWARETILWLDYDGRISKTALSDAGTFAAYALSGSVLICTLNVKPTSLDLPQSDLIKKLRKAVGSTFVPASLKPEDLVGPSYGEVCGRIVESKISATLADRNSGLSDDKKLKIRRLFNFRYQDGVPMATFGWILSSHEDESKFDRCRFSDFKFCFSSAPYRIAAPVLTPKEARLLDRHLPNGLTGLAGVGIPQAEIDKYSPHYRYYPNFSDVEQ